jgi:molecular chaperone HscB
VDPFDTLGLPPRFDLEAKELETRYRDLLRTLHPDKHMQAGATQRRESLSRSVDVNDAYRVLKDELKRAGALLARYGKREKGDPQDPELLMEIMELREALETAKRARDLVAARQLSGQVSALEGQARQALRETFAMLEQQALPHVLDAAARALSRLTYYRRFQDEVAAIEEDALG